MKLSIIIPIYGVEKYIKKCILSCVNQKGLKIGTDYEIICVNDGTKDKSAQIAKYIASKYEGITVIDQKNQGLSAARNTGLYAAKGEYIWYVDSDDYIKENCLRDICDKLKNKLDILQIQPTKIYEIDSHEEIYTQTVFSRVITGKVATQIGGLSAPAQFCIYRRRFLLENNLLFVKGIYHEDSEFKPRAVYMASSIEHYPPTVYFYLQRESGSIMSSFNPKKVYDLMIVVNNLLEFCKNKVDKADKQKWLAALSGPVSEMMFVAISSKNEKIIQDANDFMKQKPDCSLALKSSRNFLLRVVGYASILTKNAFPIYKLLFVIRYRKV